MALLLLNSELASLLSACTHVGRVIMVSSPLWGCAHVYITSVLQTIVPLLRFIMFGLIWRYLCLHLLFY
jgi:hypothetical protein